MAGDIVWPGAKDKLHLAELFERPDSETRRERSDRHMQGLRKILRALAIVLLPLVGTVIIYGSSSGLETAIGLAFILLAFGLIATWFWQPW
jgi:hypothetical protein